MTRRWLWRFLAPLALILAQTAMASELPRHLPLRIVAVEDQRQFSVLGKDSSVQTRFGGALKAEQILGIRREGTAYGPLLASVPALIRTGIARGFRQAGYRLPSKTTSDYAGATPVTIKIQQLWVWNDPEASPPQTQFRAEIALSTPDTPLITGTTLMVSGGLPAPGPVPTESDWQATGTRLQWQLAETLAQRLN